MTNINQRFRFVNIKIRIEILRKFLDYHVERRLKTVKFIKEIA